MTDQEEWRPVVGWEGLYEVSSLGRARSLERVVHDISKARAPRVRSFPGFVLRGYIHTGFGYRVFAAHRGGRRKTIYIHRAVCEAFHGPPPSHGHQAAHLDGDPTNARADNVRWATPAENAADKKLHGTHVQGEAMTNAKLTPAAVAEIRAARGVSQRELARRFGVAQGQISDVRTGKRWNPDQELAIREDLKRRLTDEQVRSIRSICGRTQADIAAEFGVSRSHVGGIRSGLFRRDA